ncbi:MauE/DoxX family redox-associated membrane protein [Streptomyces sp. H10-C2]|uniref:MauE/DoxX family redox-associated membrane protein n=1 Tax=unclassified Streptomyces TaxID=2593676 RepID=UPI0024BBE939|nr:MULTISPECIES: MauE/DoxX family redox-associated membrane protein [unclassified Streptomyces]MDJ0345386.1 MauE/DoxX family redox-associated membrane protein [Streptomyces sp. PH10-H1]MDJ0372140.1 MauE/DoxX family redox-associated membrane protein [Streptomyces sp. H10-C2]
MVLRSVLGAVYTAMSLGQLVSFGRMPSILATYRLVDGAAATVLAVVLIAGELVCGIWFLARPRSTARAPVWVYTAVSVMWAALAVQAYARGLAVANCGCFGVHLSQPLSWIVLVQDALTLLYAAVLLHAAGRARTDPDQARTRTRTRTRTGVAHDDDHVEMR